MCIHTGWAYCQTSSSSVRLSARSSRTGFHTAGSLTACLSPLTSFDRVWRKGVDGVCFWLPIRARLFGQRVGSSYRTGRLRSFHPPELAGCDESWLDREASVGVLFAMRFVARLTSAGELLQRG